MAAADAAARRSAIHSAALIRISLQRNECQCRERRLGRRPTQRQTKKDFERERVVLLLLPRLFVLLVTVYIV